MVEEKAPNATSPTATGKAAKRQEMAERRKKANELFLSGWTQAQVAEQLGVSPATLSTDLKALREEWRKENLATTAQHIDRELTSLASDERDARDGLAASREQKDRAKWHEVILKIRDRRARLLGLDAPTRVEQKVDTRVAFTDDVSKILADPDATTRLLDAVQGPTIAATPVNGANGVTH